MVDCATATAQSYIGAASASSVFATGRSYDHINAAAQRKSQARGIGDREAAAVRQSIVGDDPTRPGSPPLPAPARHRHGLVGDDVRVCLYPIAIGLIYGPLLLCLAVSELAACFRCRRRARAAERILDSAPDVPYLPLPDQQAAAGGDGGRPSSSSSSCVICIAGYARGGEGRFVMPGCVHAFHRGCVAEWLRQGNTTFPICRATAIVVVGPPGRKEKVVVAVTTAEDMV